MSKNARELAYNAIVEIKDGRGRVRGGQVIEVSEEYAIIQVFEETAGLDLARTSVSLVENVARLGVSKDMLGRRFNGIGKPIDRFARGPGGKAPGHRRPAHQPRGPPQAGGVHSNRHFHHRRHEHSGPGAEAADFFISRTSRQ